MHRVLGRIAVGIALFGTATLAAQHARLPSEPAGLFGGGVTGAYDGWFDNGDGSRSFLVGYYSRNTREMLDIPIGPANRIEPGGPDLGQPTTFLPGRHIGMFRVTVPAQFTARDTLIWTLVVNGETNQIPLRLKTDYFVSPFGGERIGNTPPVVRFLGAKPIQGPTASVTLAAQLKAKVGTPLLLTIDAEDDARYTSGTNAVPRNPPPPVAISWTQYRGPGAVTFQHAHPALEVSRGGAVGEPFAGSGTTTATFARPGDYVLHAVVNDYSGAGGGGEVCCWTNVLVRVAVSQ